MSKSRQSSGVLTYCLHCKQMTETVLYKVPFLVFMKIDRRVCLKCGEPKIQSKIEQ